MRNISIGRQSGLIILFACLLVSPSLIVGLQFDDYLQRTTILQSTSPQSAINALFIFMDGDPAHTQAKIESGAFPWYALPQGQVAFWRPLSAFTHWVDYQLWPDNPVLMHLHSLLWFALLGWVVFLFYEQLLPNINASQHFPRLSFSSVSISLPCLAAALYLLDDARGFAVGWLSNRNGLIAAVLGVLTLIVHIRWRQNNWRLGLLVAPYIFGLALLAGESAIAVLAYLLAYALFLDRASWLRRLSALTPYIVIVIIWQIVCSALGFGALGTSYVEPAREPARFMLAVIERAPILLLGQWALPPAELYPLLTSPISTVYGMTAMVGVCLLIVLMRRLRNLPLAQFFLVGSLLAAIPPSASLPANRLLFFVGLGAFGLLLYFAYQSPRSLILKVLLTFHLFVSPLLLPLTAYSPALYGNIEPALPTLPTDSAFATQTAIFVNAPSHFHIGYLSDIRTRTGKPIPARLRFLAPGVVPISLTRTDSQTLIVHPEGGYLAGFEAVFRDRSQPLAIGQVITLSDVSIEVIALTPDLRPATVAFHFQQPLDSPAYRWFQWQAGGYVPFQLPAIGPTVTLPSILEISALFAPLR